MIGRRWFLPIASGLLVILAGIAGYMSAHADFSNEWPYTGQPITVCYATDGQHLTTTMIDRGDHAVDDAYPFEASGTVSDEGDALLVTHQARIVKYGHVVRLPMVMQP